MNIKISFLSSLNPEVGIIDFEVVRRTNNRQEMYQLALEITRDDELKFDLALMLNNISIAIDTAEKYGYESMWARIGDYAVERWKVLTIRLHITFFELLLTHVLKYDLAVEAYKKAGDLGSLLILYGSTRDREGLEYVAETAGL